MNANVKTFTASATNYFYGFFAEDNAERELYVTSENIIFKRSFGTNVLRSGASGYVDVPTHDAYEGWTVTDESARTPWIAHLCVPDGMPDSVNVSFSARS